MNHTPMAVSSASLGTPAASRPGRGERLWSIGQFVAAVGVTVAFLIYLLVNPLQPPAQPIERVPPPTEVVKIVGPGLIHVAPGSPFDKKVQVVVTRKATLSEPMLTVTGRVVASLRPGRDKGSDFWQFDSADTLTAFTDWQKAQADIAYAETQLQQTRLLAKARLEAQLEVVKRLEKLVEAGTETLKDLTAERANLIQMEITGRQEVHQAETALRVARREEAVQARRLQQAGLSIELLRSVTSDVDIVMADVPEGRLNLVHVGQGCMARFLGLPKERFYGRVESIAPVLSAERRSLRVLFTIDDPEDKLRPGMFAEIGLGTDPREALLVPADAVLHIGRADYVLVAAGDHTWRVDEVQVGEPFHSDVQILEGLASGDRVIGKGAILFKPLVVRSLLQLEASR
ncbi:MAG: efflux RND transporter periplasmic adaptor subunit [Gemmataceae bacterium]|nr:efflux RND transporter periplasmic adaptor subunit [Gemmataceae bacterium]MDW8264096.1 efflux RND transporter periplasmic adaptor subunit [Gemmataceae bacterium]